MTNDANGIFLDRALYLLEAGFHVFPLGGYGETPPDYFIRDRFNGDVDKARAAWPKQPRISWKTFQSAPPSEETVRHWAAMWPNANIGIATGKLVVVDADNMESSDWVRRNLTPTPWRVKTGKGYHYYYAANPQLEIRNSADPLAKIDTRGTGGYVVAAGSRHSSGAVYTDDIAQDMGAVALCDLPALQVSDVEAISHYRHTNLQIASAAQPRQGSGNLVGFDASRWTTPATGEPVNEGGRNVAAASLAGQYLRQGVSLRDTMALLDNWNQSNQTPLSDTELKTVVASVARTHTANHPDNPIAIEAPTPQPNVSSKRKKIDTFPAHLLNVPGMVGDIARYINITSIKVQPILALGASLALCGTLMGRKVRTRSDLRTNIYIIGVSDSGSGKEHGRKAIKRLLLDAGCLKLLGAERLASDSGLFAAIYNSPACLILKDEMGRFLKAVNDPRAAAFMAEIVTSFMELSGSADSNYFEKKRAENIDKDSRMIVQPCVCIYGTTVPGRLFQSITIADITDGFYPRMLTLHSDTPDPLPQVAADKTPPAELIDLIRLWAARPVNAYSTGNLDLAPNPLWVECSPDAQQTFDAFEAANRVRRAATRGSGIDAIWARALEHALRCALIVACGRNFDQPQIEGDDAAWACEFVKFVNDRSIAEIDVTVASNEHESQIKQVLDYVAKCGGVEKSELLRKFRSIKTAVMNDLLATLQSTDEISIALDKKPGSGTEGGRPTLRVHWNGAKSV